MIRFVGAAVAPRSVQLRSSVANAQVGGLPPEAGAGPFPAISPLDVRLILLLFALLL